MSYKIYGYDSWIGKKKAWPNFIYDKERVKDPEDRMIYGTGLLLVKCRDRKHTRYSLNLL